MLFQLLAIRLILGSLAAESAHLSQKKRRGALFRIPALPNISTPTANQNAGRARRRSRARLRLLNRFPNKQLPLLFHAPNRTTGTAVPDSEEVRRRRTLTHSVHRRHRTFPDRKCCRDRKERLPPSRCPPSSNAAARSGPPSILQGNRKLALPGV